MIGCAIGVCVVGMLSTQVCGPRSGVMEPELAAELRIERLRDLANITALDERARPDGVDRLMDLHEHRYCIRVLEFGVREGAIEPWGMTDGVIGMQLMPVMPDVGGGR